MKNADLCLLEHKMVNCSIGCGTNSSFIAFVSLSNQFNSTNAMSLSLCMDPASDAKTVLQSDVCEEIRCIPIETPSLGSCLYKTMTFWSFVILMCVGTIGFNVSNCVSDATCFDVLGDKVTSYGGQRVFGTIGFGVTALISVNKKINSSRKNNKVLIEKKNSIDYRVLPCTSIKTMQKVSMQSYPH